MGDREEQHGRGGHQGGGRGGRGNHEGGGRGGHHGDGSHREELRDDMTDIHRDRKALREADTPEERRKAEQELRNDQQELRKDWGPGMPQQAGEGHHGRGGHEGGGRGGRGDHEGRGEHEDRGGRRGGRDD